MANDKKKMVEAITAQEVDFVSWHPEPLYLLLIRTSAKGFECRGTRTYPRAVSGVFWCYPPGFIEGNREIGG